MTAILAIVRKDLRHLWPQIAIFAALLAAGALTDRAYTRIAAGSGAVSLVWYAALFACWNLVMAAIHEEPLVGDRRHWLTQPYGRGRLLTAKILFLVLAVNLPVFLMQWIVLAAVAIPPLQALPPLLWRQVFITAFDVMPAAALAAVTRNLKQAVLAVLAVIVPLFVVSFALLAWRLPALLLSPQWTASYWLKSVFSAAAVFLVGGFVLYLQYFRRATALARLVLIAGIAIAVQTGRLAPASRQFAVQELLSGSCRACGDVHVELDLRRGAENRNYFYSRDRRWPGVIHVEMPVRIEGIPPGLAPFGDRRPAELWCMGRRFYAEVDDTPPGQLWLSIDMDPFFFNRHQATPVDLSGSIQLTLFAPAGSFPAPVDRAAAIPGIGVCAPEPDAEGIVWLSCLTPARRAALALEFPGGGRQWMVTPSSVDAPSPTSFDLAPLEKFSSQAPFANSAELRGYRLITERPYVHMHARFQFRGIPLRAYPGRRNFR